MGGRKKKKKNTADNIGLGLFIKILSLILIAACAAGFLGFSDILFDSGTVTATDTEGITTKTDAFPETKHTSSSTGKVTSQTSSSKQTQTTEKPEETTGTATETSAVEKPGISDDEMNRLIKKQLLVINEYSRPGIKLDSVDYIVVHYVANPGTSAKNNRDYFNNLSKTHTTSVSAHFIIGLDGEIIQCVPTDEVAYANYPLNFNSISIECCHPDSTGEFNDKTYQSLVKLVSWLCLKFNLTSDNVIRHYDVSGKLCPKYWAGEKGTDEYSRWLSFLNDLVSE